MISPVCVSECPAAVDALERELNRLSLEIRPEVVEITRRDNTVNVDFRFCGRETNPKIRAVYQNETTEPEVYTDQADWYNFNLQEYKSFYEKPNDVLTWTIELELRKALEKFLHTTSISAGVLDFILRKRENSSVIVEQSKIFINLFINGYHIEYEMGPDADVNMVISQIDKKESPPLNMKIPLACLTDFVDIAEHHVRGMEDAVDLANEVLRRISNVFYFIDLSPHFPYAKLSLNRVIFTVSLNDDYASMRISSGGRKFDYPLENLVIDEVERRIREFLS